MSLGSAEGPVAHRPGLARGRIDAGLDLAADVVVELVGLSGAGGAAAVDVQVLEVPPAGLDLGQMDLPRPAPRPERSRVIFRPPLRTGRAPSAA